MAILGRYPCRYSGFARKSLFLSTFGRCLHTVVSFSSPSLSTSLVSVSPNPTQYIGKRYRLVRTGTNSSTKIRSFSSSNNQDEQAMARDAMQIVQDAIAAVDPYSVIRSNIVREENVLNFKNANFKLDLAKDYDEIILVSFGKASSAMSASVLEQIFPAKLIDSMIDVSCSGVVICKDGHATQTEKGLLVRHGVEIYEASHPVPDNRSIEAADRLIQLVSSRASDRSLVICCISGGGSSLFCRPTEPLTLDDLQQVYSVLLASGMSIQEINVLRKRLENGKGGRLAASCFPSHVVALILSDVVGDPLDLIASGPTVPDESNWQHGWDIIKQYNLEEKLPRAVLEMFQEGLDGKLDDSPSSNHPIFENTKNILVGNNALAVQAASDTAKTLGYQPVVLGTEIEGEAKEVAKMYIAMSSYLQNTLANKSDESNQKKSDYCVPYTIAQSLPVALIGGGESTVTLTAKSGKGGRNQELALSAALQLNAQNLRNVVLISVGTDGGDGPTDAAGAVVDATTTRNSRSRALQALAEHDAYSYLDSLQDTAKELDDIPSPLIKTGPTGTNVADICVTLIKPPPEHLS